MLDRTLNIAVGQTRQTKTWKNKKITWANLVERLSKPTRTQETAAEYALMSKESKARVKDVGGFVGGYCDGGNRSKVRFRSCLTLDADSVKTDIWETWLDLYGNAACLYSTHSHTEEAPRYRLIIPTDRDMSPDEFQAVSRRVADTLGIDNFDESTHQPQRLMYWPSCSRDAEYVYKVRQAELLSVDEVLGTYVDWRDMSAWPTNSSVPKDIAKKAKRQSDPLEKGGIVGAFCKVYYPIQTAIEEFIPSYEACSDGRYTYTEGSAAAGVVIYQDKFSYSNHATDPASCQLCNAFDLVRIHKFGALDEETSEDTPAVSRPSWKAMAEFAQNIEAVKVQLLTERRAAALDDFNTDYEETDWLKKLRVNKNGAVEQSINNVFIALNEDPKLKGRIAFDRMNNRIVTVDDLPWRKIRPKKLSNWDDNDDAALRMYLEHIGLNGKDRIYDAVNNTAQRHVIHPVKDFIEAVKWDGTPRVEKLFIDYLGAADTAYSRTVTRKTLIAAVARIYNPGCKFDYVLSLRGRQGIGKSSILQRLAGEWFSDSLTTMSGKDAYDQIQGVWIMELGELASMKKAEIENIKNYLSATVDKYRPAYGRRIQEFPRQCIFIATTNEVLFLRDSTGNRRFWVLDCPEKAEKQWLDLTDSEVHQIWAEAKKYYDDGEDLFLDDVMEAEARRIQASFTQEDSNVGIIEDYLERLLPADWADMELDARRNFLASDREGVLKRTTVCSREIYSEALGRSPDKVDSYEITMINKTMSDVFSAKGWHTQGSRQIRTKLYKKQRYFLLDGYTTDWVRVKDDESEDYDL